MGLHLTEDYRVRLDAFEGPLDLLLFLIRKDEIDVHDIPIARITDQYLAFVHAHAGRLDIDVAGEFLVMAATLTEIKSRCLLPKAAGAARDASADAPPEDPRAELVKQLLEYKRYRDAADSLERRADEWSHRFGTARAGLDDAALSAALDDAGDLELEDLSLVDLVDAFKRIAETVNFERLGDHQVTYDDTPLELHAADILTRLDERQAQDQHRPGEVGLFEVFSGRTRSEMVGLFLALLELVRGGKVKVRMDRSDGRVLLRREAQAESTSGAEGSSGTEGPGERGA
jgi:segregation and condensation protein A